MIMLIVSSNLYSMKLWKGFRVWFVGNVSNFVIFISSPSFFFYLVVWFGIRELVVWFGIWLDKLKMTEIGGFLKGKVSPKYGWYGEPQLPCCSKARGNYYETKRLIFSLQQGILAQ
jgi:hypothetical protein